MTITEILTDFKTTNYINDQLIKAIQQDVHLKVNLVNYFRHNQNRDFALGLINKLIAVRKSPGGAMPIEDLMFGCYILSLHHHMEDALKIWEAKNVDFDTYCGLDIQLMVFEGVNATMQFLQKQDNDDARAALEYVIECEESGDFNDIDQYFSDNNTPWFL